MQLDPEPEPDSTALYIVVLIALIFLSAFFSASETAFTSINKVRLKVRAQDDDRTEKQRKRSLKTLKMVEDYDRLLFTLLIGNNIVNITASTIATLLFIAIMNGSAAAPTVSTAVITITVLIFGEIVPKTLAKERPEGFAESICGILKFFV
ncbi:MAG: DUF21 domain-containing protein, partial [Clostridia bacterium]|nr:DUF21 domain-containing protein [Clostridia bacterium]